jgi:phosphoenolpyruvate-protein kinase (PTS system EI component)
MEAERGNSELTHYSDALHPAVLQLIGQVVRSAQSYGKWVGVCGELAGDPVAVPVLVGLGIGELSMNPNSIPKVKNIIGHLRMSAAKSLADQVLQADSAPSVRTMAQTFIDEIGNY